MCQCTYCAGSDTETIKTQLELYTKTYIHGFVNRNHKDNIWLSYKTE